MSHLINTAFAAFGPVSSGNKDFAGLVSTIVNSIFQPLVGLIVAGALAYFLWGVLKYVRSGEEKEKDEARRAIGWGLLALAIMLSVWGLVTVIQNTFSLDNGTPPTPFYGTGQ